MEYGDFNYHQLFQFLNGAGCGCLESGTLTGPLNWTTPIIHTFHFTWVPDGSGEYNIMIKFYYHGAYGVYANEDWMNCKYAGVDCSAHVEVEQFWPPFERGYDVFSSGGSTINEFEPLFGLLDRQYTVPLTGGHFTYLLRRL